MITTQQQDQVLHDKIQHVRELESQTKQFYDLTKPFALDITPQSQYASFPYHDYTPYCQPLTPTQLLEELGVDNSTITTKKLINQSCDVSGSPDGVCIVTRTILLSNSHAGTHADQPAHFERDPPFTYFDDFQYNGPCAVLNLKSLVSNGPIQIDHLKQFIDQGLIDPLTVTRLLLHTRTTPQENEQWSSEFAHFDPKCAEWLVATFPNLLLIGIDTPSMDHPSASPIIACSHGALWKQRVAILENLKLQELFDNEPNVVTGFIQTIWNPMQTFKDSRGCLVRYFKQ